jgi:hypothetical protein
MPTVKPRVWVTLEPEAYEVLVGMARLGRSTPGRVLSEIASPVLPALKRLVEAADEFAAWERSLKGQLSEAHKEVTDGIDQAIRALEARRVVPVVGGPSVQSRAGEGPVAPSSVAGRAGPGRASMPRSTQPGPALEAPPRGRKTPPTNRGVILTRRKQNQQVTKGGPGRGV